MTRGPGGWLNVSTTQAVLLITTALVLLVLIALALLQWFDRLP